MSIIIKRCSIFSAGLVLLFGSSMVTAEQNGQIADYNLSCKYTKVDYTGRPPFKRTTVKGKCLERADFARFEDTSGSTSKKQHRSYGHPTTRKR
jgi:hypothetical protein